MTNSTDLATLSTKESHLAIFQEGNEDVQEALEANIGGDTLAIHDLPQALTPSGGGLNFKINDGGANVARDLIMGAPLGWFKDGRLFGTEDMSNDKPVLVTHDMKFGYMVNEDIGDFDIKLLEAAAMPDQGDGKRWFDWNKLAYNEWGSGKNEGKRCKEYRIVPVLEQDALLPIVVRVPSASIKDCDRFRMTAFGIKPYYRCVVTASLIEVPKAGKKAAYSKVVFEKAPGELTKEQGLYLKAMYINPMLEVIERDTLSLPQA